LQWSRQGGSKRSSWGGQGWNVLKVEDDEALIISSSFVASKLDEEVDPWLKGEFYNQFSAEEKARIISTEIENDGAKSNQRIWLLSENEVTTYFPTKELRTMANGWYLRDGFVNKNGSLGIDLTTGSHVYSISAGQFVFQRYPISYGVRPAMWINLDTKVVTNSAESSSTQQTKSIGETISFGDYDWLILDSQGEKALVITKAVAEKRAYTDSDDDTALGGYLTTWEDSALRKYLNGEFYNKFTQQERSRILETTVNTPNTVYTSLDGHRNESIGGSETTDKIFLLSIDEAKKYFGTTKKLVSDYFMTTGEGSAIGHLPEGGGFDYLSQKYEQSNDLIATFEGSATFWWLRSPGKPAVDPATGTDNSDSWKQASPYSPHNKSISASPNAVAVTTSGYIDVLGIDADHGTWGVRPAMWITLD
jgi:hypothetical protein